MNLFFRQRLSLPGYRREEVKIFWTQGATTGELLRMASRPCAAGFF
jgi:hypothetical protein